jgi:hypothetical protein
MQSNDLYMYGLVLKYFKGIPRVAGLRSAEILNFDIFFISNSVLQFTQWVKAICPQAISEKLVIKLNNYKKKYFHFYTSP